ncbi:hypothetical protein LR48_Vigan09g057300 [Vigna angularis]|uniref:Uncharacterized protein n=1 Tax=Phaseolus angularis TaxID=3914 RepID=A0A0L9VB86_PHAAN|nr:hypothetical protein LR48_Vigan09g057300 [Vigna angularis]
MSPSTTMQNLKKGTHEAWRVYERRRYRRGREGDRTVEDSGRIVENEDARPERGELPERGPRTSVLSEQSKDERPEQVEVTGRADERPERGPRTSVLSEWKQQGRNERNEDERPKQAEAPTSV